VNLRETKNRTNFGNVLKIGHGVENHLEPHPMWIANMHKMYAICHVFRKSFYGFLQPSSFSKGYILSETEENYFKIRHSERALKEFKYNIDKADQTIINSKFSYIFSLNSLFVNKSGIFYDHCHCLDKWNKVISQSIFQILKEKDEYFRSNSFLSR
jgi:hypothetical protein